MCSRSAFAVELAFLHTGHLHDIANSLLNRHSLIMSPLPEGRFGRLSAAGLTRVSATVLPFRELYPVVTENQIELLMNGHRG